MHGNDSTGLTHTGIENQPWRLKDDSQEPTEQNLELPYYSGKVSGNGISEKMNFPLSKGCQLVSGEMSEAVINCSQPEASCSEIVTRDETNISSFYDIASNATAV